MNAPRVFLERWRKQKTSEESIRRLWRRMAFQRGHKHGPLDHLRTVEVFWLLEWHRGQQLADPQRPLVYDHQLQLSQVSRR
eukprot:symbB.v1.2.014285.t1/scaffold1043.1/size142240/2